MELQELDRNFGTESQCLNYLFQLRWSNGYRCPRCQFDEMWEVTAHKYKCKRCGYQTTVIAGTLFQDTHIPLPLWFRAIWYISESPQKVTGALLQRELGLGSNRTALMMLNKIKYAQANSTHTKLEKLQGTVEVDREQINGYMPRRYLAVAAEIGNGKISRIRAKVLDNTSLESMNTFMTECIETGSTILTNYWDGRDKVMRQRYAREVQYETYDFPYAEKAFRLLRRELSNCKNPTDCVDKFCFKYNAPKNKITFFDILKTTMRLRPTPHADSYCWKV